MITIHTNPNICAHVSILSHIKETKSLHLASHLPPGEPRLTHMLVARFNKQERKYRRPLRNKTRTVSPSSYSINQKKKKKKKKSPLRSEEVWLFKKSIYQTDDICTFIFSHLNNFHKTHYIYV